MLAEFSKIAGDTNLVFKADLLVAEKDHLIAHESVVQLRHLLVAQRPGQIDVADFGADMRAARRGGDGLISDSLGNGCNLRNLRQMGGGTHGDFPASRTRIAEYSGLLGARKSRAGSCFRAVVGRCEPSIACAGQKDSTPAALRDFDPPEV